MSLINLTGTSLDSADLLFVRALIIATTSVISSMIKEYYMDIFYTTYCRDLICQKCEKRMSFTKVVNIPKSVCNGL